MEYGPANITTYDVVVNYGQSFAEMVAVGNYDLVDSEIAESPFQFGGEGRQNVTLTLFHFNRSISSEDAIDEMKQQGFRPGRIEHLLALGAAHTELQKQFPIASLGSSWRRPFGSVIPHLGYDDDIGRYLRLPWFACDWPPNFRLIALRDA